MRGATLGRSVNNVLRHGASCSAGTTAGREGYYNRTGQCKNDNYFFHHGILV